MLLNCFVELPKLYIPSADGVIVPTADKSCEPLTICPPLTTFTFPAIGCENVTCMLLLSTETILVGIKTFLLLSHTVTIG